MPRPKDIIPKRRIETAIPKPLWDLVELFLHSDLEGRIPVGVWQAFMIERIEEFFSHRTLDLAPFIGSDPGLHIVQGPVETLRALQSHLAKEIKNG